MRGKLKRLIAPVAVALLLGLTGCAGSNGADTIAPADVAGESSGETQNQQSAGEQQASTGSGTVKFGESVEFAPEADTALKVTLQAPTDQSALETMVPAEGKYVYIAAEAVLTDGIMGVVSGDEFTLVDGEGNRYEQAAATLDDMFLEMLAPNGEPGTGMIVYDVPEGTDLSSLKVEWEATDSSDKPVGIGGTWTA